MEGLHITNAYRQGLIHVQNTVLAATSTDGCGELYGNSADRPRTTLNICQARFVVAYLALLVYNFLLPSRDRQGLARCFIHGKPTVTTSVLRLTV